MPVPDPNNVDKDNRKVDRLHAKHFGEYLDSKQDWVAPALLARDRLTSKVDGTVSGSMDIVYGNGSAQYGSVRLYSPTYTLTNGHVVPNSTVTGTLHLTAAGTLSLGPIGANIAAGVAGAETDAGCTLTSTPSPVTSVVIT